MMEFTRGKLEESRERGPIARLARWIGFRRVLPSRLGLKLAVSGLALAQRLLRRPALAPHGRGATRRGDRRPSPVPPRRERRMMPPTTPARGESRPRPRPGGLRDAGALRARQPRRGARPWWAAGFEVASVPKHVCCGALHAHAASSSRRASPRAVHDRALRRGGRLAPRGARQRRLRRPHEASTGGSWAMTPDGPRARSAFERRVVDMSEVLATPESLERLGPLLGDGVACGDRSPGTRRATSATASRSAHNPSLSSTLSPASTASPSTVRSPAAARPGSTRCSGQRTASRSSSRSWRPCDARARGPSSPRIPGATSSGRSAWREQGATWRSCTSPRRSTAHSTAEPRSGGADERLRSREAPDLTLPVAEVSDDALVPAGEVHARDLVEGLLVLRGPGAVANASVDRVEAVPRRSRGPGASVSPSPLSFPSRPPPPRSPHPAALLVAVEPQVLELLAEHGRGHGLRGTTIKVISSTSAPALRR